MHKKTAQMRERQARTKDKGVAAQVIMVVDIDGRRGIVSPDGQNVVWRSSFDECWRIYIQRERRLAKEQAEEKIEASHAVTQ